MKKIKANRQLLINLRLNRSCWNRLPQTIKHYDTTLFELIMDWNGAN